MVLRGEADKLEFDSASHCRVGERLDPASSRAWRSLDPRALGYGPQPLGNPARAARRGRSARGNYELARRGDLPARRVGRRWLFLRDRLAAAITPLDDPGAWKPRNGA